MGEPAARKTEDGQALVIDSNAISRGLMVSQLREYGIGRVVPCARVRDARLRLETGHFDFVLCERNFADGEQSGQALLDDLRQAQLLPFSTVFFMVTSESSYATVAEAAESALDGYLLKPFTPATLFERLRLAQLRKANLASIFAAIDAGEFDRAADLCMQRFRARDADWLYAARIGAELLLRTARHDEARILYEAVVGARALPWARLGVARAQIQGGQTTRAVSTLEDLLGADGNFTDAYDVMGAAQVELGKFSDALETYRRAAELTPSSIPRLQKHGMMAFYQGDHETASRALSRAIALGVDSKMFDPQALVLMAFTAFHAQDRRAMERCVADFVRILEKRPDDLRVRRFQDVTQALRLIQQRQLGPAVEAVRAQARHIAEPAFDFEAGCNLGSLLALLASTSIELEEGADWVTTLALRFCGTRSLAELLASACKVHEPYAAAVREAHAAINRLAEQAMSRNLGGDAAGAVEGLLAEGQRTLSGKLVDLAQQLLVRQQDKIAGPELLQARIDALRAGMGAAPRATVGQERHRAPGALLLRVKTPDAPRPTDSLAPR